MSGESAGKANVNDGRQPLRKRARCLPEQPDQQVSVLLTKPPRHSSSNLDASKTVASEMGAKVVAQKRLPNKIEIFPIIDITQDDETIPSSSAHNQPISANSPSTSATDHRTPWKMASAKTAIDLRVPDAMEMFPVIDLTQEDAMSTGIGGQSKQSSKAPLQGRVAVGHGWDCPRCTFVNSASGNVCSMCCLWKSPASSTAIGDQYEGEDVEYLRQMHEQQAIQQWERIVAFCRQDKSQFVDDRFLPTSASLSVCKAPPEFSTIRAWLRPFQLKQCPANDPDLDGWTVCGAPLTSDIQQGNLADCWLLYSLSVVAERPELLHNVLVTKKYNSEGAYLVRLCIDGLWKVILVDDLFPADENGNLVFSKARRQQLWVPLIEKALSKAHGSYYSIAWGSIMEGLTSLTGAPCESFDLDAATNGEYDAVWQHLLSFHKSRFLMGAICGKLNSSLTEQDYLAVGLNSNHAYSLLDVSDACGNRLVRLRDPSGRPAWRGDWSDGSTVWTAGLRQQLQPDGDAEGLFWISLPDCIKYFSSVEVSKYRDHWKELRVQGTFPNCALHSKWSVWMLTVTQQTEVDLTLYQQGYRGGSREMNYHHLDMAVLVFSITPDRKLVQLVAASPRTAAVSAFVGESALLEPGQYFVWTLAFNHFIDMVLPEETFAKNTLAMHSATSIVVERVPAPPYALAEAIILWTVNKGECWYPRGSLKDGEGVAAYLVFTGGLILVYENRYRKHSVQMQCDCSASRNLISTRGALVTVDVIPPLSRCVICVLSPSHDGNSYQLHYSTRYRLLSAGDEGLGDWGPAGVDHVPAIDTDVLRDLHYPRPL